MNWQQLQAIAWLRWRLTRNRFLRAGALNAVVASLLLALLLAGAVAFAAAGLLTGALALKDAGPQVLLCVWDGVLLAFLVFWLSGLMIEIQRAESIDLTKLLHLPVTLQQVFLFNYVASHCTPSILLFLPAMLGLCAGSMLSQGPAMLLLVPLGLSLLFLLTAWTYWLRGWLAALIVNKRRRQAVIVWMTIGFVLVWQVPNLFVNSRLVGRHRRTTQPEAAGHAAGKTQSGSPSFLPKAVVQAHLAVPLGWLGYGAMALGQHNPWPAIGATAASCLLGAFGLVRAYRMTLRFYQGAGGQVRVAPAPKPKTGARGPLLVERRLPWLPDDTAALALATFRSMLRAPEMKMGMVIPVVALLALVTATSVSAGRAGHATPGFLTAFAGTAAAVFGVFPLLGVMSNAFGLDRNAFRALVLLPTRRHHILLAKNLAFFPFIGAIAVVFLLVVKFLVRMSWEAFLASLLQVPVAFLLSSLACNVVAVLVPYRLAAGTLQAKKPKPIVFLAVFVVLLVLPIIMAPVLIPPGLALLCSWQGWLPGLPVNLLGSAMMLAAAGWLYRLLLPFEGRLLQRREQAILHAVTEEVE
jgi:ABC-2 type transport system permease protein